MPTDVAIGQRRNAALARIMGAVGGDTLELPRFTQAPSNVRHLKQFEFLADYIEQSVNGADSNIPEKYLKAEQLARENANKADIIAALLEDN